MVASRYPTPFFHLPIAHEDDLSELRRYHTSGNWYFITSVTYLRRPILVMRSDLLLTAFERARAAAADAGM